MVVTIVISVLKASINSVLDVVEMFGDSAKYVVVKNRGRVEARRRKTSGCTTDTMTAKPGAKGLRKTVEAHGGETIVMQEMQAETIQWMDEFDFVIARTARASCWAESGTQLGEHRRRRRPIQLRKLQFFKAATVLMPARWTYSCHPFSPLISAVAVRFR